MCEFKDDLDSGIFENVLKLLLKEEIFVCFKLMCNNCYVVICIVFVKV